MSWAPGTIVRCVNAVLAPEDFVQGAMLAAGAYFTIREVTPMMMFRRGPSQGVKLAENIRIQVHPGITTYVDCEWDAIRFCLAEGAASESARARQLAELNK